MLGGRARSKVTQQIGELGSGQRQAGVRSPIIETDLTAWLVQNPAAGKHYAIDVTLRS